MKESDFKTLKRGDIVRHISGSMPYIVTGNYGDHVIAVSTIQMMNPDEWKLERVADYSPFVDDPPHPKETE